LEAVTVMEILNMNHAPIPESGLACDADGYAGRWV
jgi:hypothetical protein